MKSTRPSCLIPAAVAVLCGLAADDAWPAGSGEDVLHTFKVDQSRTGYLPAGPRPPLRLLWKFQSRETRAQIEAFYTTDDGFSPASIHEGVVYAGGHDGWIFAIGARSGRKVWEHKTGGHVVAAPQYR